MLGNKIDYTLRESPRARRVILRVGVKGLEVVVPRRFGRRRLPEIIEAHRDWIEKELQRIQESPAVVAPHSINLLSISNTWEVDYQSLASSNDRFSVKEDAAKGILPDRLLVKGDVDDVPGVSLVLIEWLHGKAHAHLVPWLKEISQEVAIPFQKATVRGQATRWASCSQSGNISLNRSLLFLPARLVRHVFLHELCHIREAHHAPGFWKHLSRFEPEFKGFESEVKKADGYVPDWVSLR